MFRTEMKRYHPQTDRQVAALIPNVERIERLKNNLVDLNATDRV